MGQYGSCLKTSKNSWLMTHFPCLKMSFYLLCICESVCLYLSVPVCVYLCIFLSVCVCLFVCVYVCEYICLLVYMCMSMYVSVCVCVGVCVCFCICVCEHVHAHTYGGQEKTIYGTWISLSTTWVLETKLWLFNVPTPEPSCQP